MTFSKEKILACFMCSIQLFEIIKLKTLQIIEVTQLALPNSTFEPWKYLHVSEFSTDHL